MKKFILSLIIINLLFNENTHAQTSVVCDVGSFFYKIGTFGLSIYGPHNHFIYPKYPKGNPNMYSYWSSVRGIYILNKDIIEFPRYYYNAVKFEESEDITVKSINKGDDAISDYETKSILFDFDNKNDECWGTRLYGICKTYCFSENFRNDFLIFDYKIVNRDYLTKQGFYFYNIFQPWMKEVDLSKVNRNNTRITKKYQDDNVAHFYIGTDEEFIPDEKLYLGYVYEGDDSNTPEDDSFEVPGYFGISSLKSTSTNNIKFGENTPSFFYWFTDEEWFNLYSDMELYNLINDSSRAYKWGDGIPTYIQYIFMGWGPYNIAPGDSVHIVFAMGIGDTFEKMVENFKWARRTYRSGFKSPVPVSPDFTYHYSTDGIVLKWNTEQINYVNPFTDKSGFSGYKVLKINADADFKYKIDNMTEEADIPEEEIIPGTMTYLDTEVEPEKEYIYAVVNYLIDEEDKYYESSRRRFTKTIKYTLPEKFKFYRNYPNPFNNQTIIKFELPHETNVTLKIYNVLGQEVKTLIDNKFTYAGEHKVIWDGTNANGQRVSSGVYMYRIEAGGEIRTNKMVLLR